MMLRPPGAGLRRPAPLLARDDVATTALAAEIGAQFDHILVDEYQDTNVLQAEILTRLRPERRGRHGGRRRRAGDLLVPRRHGRRTSSAFPTSTPA
mgnify:CR=1 FL=1